MRSFDARREFMHQSQLREMIVAEERKQERFRLLRQPAAPVFLCTLGVRAEALAVKDVSRGGVGLYLEQPLPTGLQVSIEYEARHLTLNVNGVIIWCRPRQDSDIDVPDFAEACVIGVELFSPMLLLSAFRDALPVYALSVGEA
ncbi:MAG: PilZ domain-containing protein [Gammaproteobacteria bacterium]